MIRLNHFHRNLPLNTLHLLSLRPRHLILDPSYSREHIVCAFVKDVQRLIQTSPRLNREYRWSVGHLSRSIEPYNQPSSILFYLSLSPNNYCATSTLSLLHFDDLNTYLGKGSAILAHTLRGSSDG
jgi:hypothetical protein